MTRAHVTWCALAAVLALSGCGHVTPSASVTKAGTAVFTVGDCVEIPSDGPGAAAQPSATKPNATKFSAAKVDCTTDPSYTVGAVTDAAGECPSREYQHLPAESADEATTRLCLVPNLVANHCYVLDMPIGVVERADCTDRRTPGLLVQVTQRLDVRDQQACPSDVGQFAWPYPSPARTYCTLTVF